MKDQKFKKKMSEHFDEQSKDFSMKIGIQKFGSETMNRYLRRPYKYIEDQHLNDIDSKIILDYCCGTGVYSILPATRGAFVHGIDISMKSIELAKQKSEILGKDSQTYFQKMDAEHLDYEDDYFDLILVYGSLSYLNLEQTFKELKRVLKTSGKVIIVDSLGHNPVFNFNRRKNVKNYAPEDLNLLKTIRKSDIKLAKHYFSRLDVKFFNLFSVIGYIVSEKFGININVYLLDNLDRFFLNFPFIKWLAFKVVIVCHK
jgi:ubiquinone/menaquinone biosynthesis C-methylase UbiE